MRIAIVDDEDNSVSLLTQYIRKYEDECGLKCTISVFNKGLDFISDYTGAYDLVFMDIMMPFMDGIKTAKALRELDGNVALIFVTNLGQMAVKGYEVSALDFMIKPITYYDFTLKMKKALEHIDKYKDDRKNYLCVRTSLGIAKVMAMDIKYVEVNGRYVRLHTINGVVDMPKSMKFVEKQLEKSGMFLRCDNSYLVNLMYVSNIGRISAIVGGEEIPVSRAKRKRFMDALTIYLGQNIYRQ